MVEADINGKKPLWTKNFTIITLGSVVSMLGNALSGFAMSLLVLDYTKSSFLYALYIFFYTLPKLVMPIIAGPYLDRFSRKKVIYTLDFMSAGLYLCMGAMLHVGFFNFAIFAVACFIIGSIDSVYMIAYQSFYPLLISEGNYAKAYSVSSTLETLAMVMVPVSAYVYKTFGIVPLFIINAVSFFAAALMETRIDAEEKYVDEHKQADNEISNTVGGKKSYGIKDKFTKDLREGMAYLISEKGLLAIAIYFTFCAFSDGAGAVITLPYFKANYSDGEYVYMIVMGMAMLGRMIGGTIHYKVKLPKEKKYNIALVVYVTTSLLQGIYLYCNVGIMMAMGFMTGILGVTSYNIRISATQEYVPDVKKGRFNGIFSVLNTSGMLLGELLAGTLTKVIPERVVLAIFMFICAVAAVVFIGGRKKQVSKIYNIQA